MRRLMESPPKCINRSLLTFQTYVHGHAWSPKDKQQDNNEYDAGRLQGRSKNAGGIPQSDKKLTIGKTGKLSPRM